MTPRQDTDGHDDNDNTVLPPTITTSPADPPTPPKLRRPLSSAAAEFRPRASSSSKASSSSQATSSSPASSSSRPASTLIRPSLELVPPKRSPTVDSLLSALTPDEPRETKEEDTDELWAKLRCGSLRTEEVAEREKQKQERLAKRQNRCPDYPGLAFGSAMFGSDTTMRFNIIKNELHNIMRSQLKRVDGEVNALAGRVKKLDMNLEESERLIRSATAALSECVSLQIEESKSRSQETESQDSLSAFDQHILYLETQLKDAKIKASQSLQVMEDCDRAQESLLDAASPMTPYLPPLPPPLPPTRPPTLLPILPPALSPLPQSSTAALPHPNTILNNNTAAPNNNVNQNNTATTNSMFENEANNNNNSVTRNTEVSMDMNSENKNCLQAFMTEEDSANGNTALPV